MVKKRIKHLKDLIARCFRCGLCRAVCPVFLELEREPAVARGKVQLVKAMLDGDIEPSGNLAHLLSRCLSCGACQQTCPGDVQVTEIILRARAELVPGQVLDIQQEEFSSLTQWARYLKTAQSAAERPLPAILKLLVEIHGQALPRIPAESSSRRGDKQNKLANPKMRVGYFPGCADEIYPGVVRAVVNILEKNSIAAVIPEGLACCGWPFLEAGDFSTARRLTQQNIEVLQKQDLDAILTSCTAGVRMLKRDYRELFGLEGFRVSIYDIAEFLADVLPDRVDFSALPLKVTYLTSSGLSEDEDQHRKLLTEIPELELVELEEPEGRCAGSLFFWAVQRELSGKILHHKLEAIAKSGADVVITGSPLSMLQLEWGLKLRGMPHRIMHTAEVLAGAWGVGQVPSLGAKPGAAASKKS
jgi:glycolate oxidase iron-sulfur subunit